MGFFLEAFISYIIKDQLMHPLLTNIILLRYVYTMKIGKVTQVWTCHSTLTLDGLDQRMPNRRHTYTNTKSYCPFKEFQLIFY